MPAAPTELIRISFDFSSIIGGPLPSGGLPRNLPEHLYNTDKAAHGCSDGQKNVKPEDLSS